MDKVLTIDLEVMQNAQPIEMSVVNESEPIALTVEYAGGGGGRLPNYDGAYEVTPRKVEQILATKNKSMSDNVTVFSIPYQETTNVGGGYTAVIGLE